MPKVPHTMKGLSWYYKSWLRGRKMKGCINRCKYKGLIEGDLRPSLSPSLIVLRKPFNYLSLMPGGEDGDGAEEPAGQGVLDGGRVPGPLRHSSPAARGEDEGLSGAGQTSRHHGRHHHQQEHVANYLLEEKGLQVIYLIMICEIVICLFL